MPPVSSAEVNSGLSQLTSRQTSKSDLDSQQPLQVVVTPGGACTLRGRSEHDGLVARTTHGIFAWMRNEQEDDFDGAKTSDSYGKSEVQVPGSHQFGNEANCCCSSSDKSDASSVSSNGSISSSPLSNFDSETDSSQYEILWEELTVGEQIGQGSCGTVFHGMWCGSVG
ncbi:hypothetical protein MKW94_010627 [Papaver nudicaule]|uniref:Uncharacterized protein n=1 Tax=Papaver nudicaule TaxID=74823 RepID=A0AA41UXS7_PAPNU|nr:hypothetical protein [Papaver nudicaule]